MKIGTVQYSIYIYKYNLEINYHNNNLLYVTFGWGSKQTLHLIEVLLFLPLHIEHFQVDMFLFIVIIIKLITNTALVIKYTHSIPVMMIKLMYWYYCTVQYMIEK